MNGAKRSSAATSYLAPQYLERKNLHVLVNTRVTRLFEVGDEGLDFRGVEFAQARDGKSQFPNQTNLPSEILIKRRISGPRHRVTAHKEVLLSAGTVGSAQVLLLSGVGDAAHLTSVGVEAIHDLPGVGQNLSDHTRVGTNFYVNSTETFDQITRDSAFSQQMFEQWKVNGTGPLVDTFMNHLIFMRLDDSVMEANSFDLDDPAAGPNSGHIELGVSVC